MYNKKSLKNLKRFSSEYQPKKKGRPKGSPSVIKAIEDVLVGVDEGSQKPILELLAISATKQAMKGNAAYFKEIIERLDGKVKERIEHTGNNREPVIFKVVYKEKELPED